VTTEAEMDAALSVLRAGGVVAAATESSFGLLVDAASSTAIDNLVALKPRGTDKAMPLILPNRAAWSVWIRECPPLAERLADAFWPGPLTIAVGAAPGVDSRLLLDDRIAVRWPRSSVAAMLAERLGRALTATSANPTGVPAAMRAEQVNQGFAAAIARSELVVVPGTALGAAPSSVVIVEGMAARIVRVGAIGAEQIERAIAERS
jgi:L-threonylcarbamoyladenylate synthase